MTHTGLAAIAVLILAVAAVALVYWYYLRPKLQQQGAAAGIPAGDSVASSTVIIGTWVIVFTLAGLGALFAWSYGSTAEKFNDDFWRMFGTDVMIAGAAGAIGGLLGFVFGIPRTLDPAARAAVAAAANQGPAATSQAALAANTNLERVSDWLTTLIIGATLVQSQQVIKWIGTLGTEFKFGALTNEALVPVAIVYFFALAFLGIYLITRLYLTFALQQTLGYLTGSTVLQAPQITTAALPDGRVGAVYGPVKLLCTGGSLPLTWAVVNLPAGLTLDAASGQIGGTPTAAGNAACVVTVSDSSPAPVSTSRTLNLTVVP